MEKNKPRSHNIFIACIQYNETYTSHQPNNSKIAHPSSKAYSARIKHRARLLERKLHSSRYGAAVIFIDQQCAVHVIVSGELTYIKRRGVVGVAGASVSRLEDEACNAGVLDDVTPAGICDIVGSAQHGRRWISITVCPVPDTLPLPWATIGAGHATWSTGLHLRQAGLPLATADRSAVCVLCKTKGAKNGTIGGNVISMLRAGNGRNFRMINFDSIEPVFSTQNRSFIIRGVFSAGQAPRASCILVRLDMCILAKFLFLFCSFRSGLSRPRESFCLYNCFCFLGLVLPDGDVIRTFCRRSRLTYVKRTVSSLLL